MSSASNYTENKLLDHSLGVASYTMPTTVYVALFNNVSTSMQANLEANIKTDEIAQASYARKAVTFGAASGGTSANSGDVTFDVAAQLWGPIEGIAIMDQSTGGNVLYWGTPATIKSIDIGDIYQIKAGNLQVSLS